MQHRKVTNPVALAEVREGQPGHRQSELPRHSFQRSDPVVLQEPESRKLYLGESVFQVSVAVHVALRDRQYRLPKKHCFFLHAVSFS